MSQTCPPLAQLAVSFIEASEPLREVYPMDCKLKSFVGGATNHKTPKPNSKGYHTIASTWKKSVMLCVTCILF